MKKVLFLLSIVVLLSCEKEICTICTTETMHWTSPDKVISSSEFSACGSDIVSESYGTITVNGELFITHTTCNLFTK